MQQTWTNTLSTRTWWAVVDREDTCASAHVLVKLQLLLMEQLCCTVSLQAAGPAAVCLTANRTVLALFALCHQPVQVYPSGFCLLILSAVPVLVCGFRSG